MPRTPRNTMISDRARANAAEARRRPGKRRLIDPTTTDRDYGSEELEFMLAMDDYRRTHLRNFPTWSEALEVLRSLGYRKDPAHTSAPSLLQAQPQ